MDKFFDADNPFMRFLARMVDLAMVNLLTLLFSIPIITLGGAMSAMNYVLLHLVREDETYIIRMFRKSFKENFRQGILEGLLVLIVAGVTAADMWIIHGSESKIATFFMVTLTVIAVFIFVTCIYMFALQSRYENTVMETMLNAVKLAIGNLPRTLGMIICWIAWAFALIFIGKAAASLVFIFFGLSLPGYLCAMLYDKVFVKLEEH
jgi:uncharacterized membrane protein YesL